MRIPVTCRSLPLRPQPPVPPSCGHHAAGIDAPPCGRSFYRDVPVSAGVEVRPQDDEATLVFRRVVQLALDAGDHGGQPLLPDRRIVA